MSCWPWMSKSQHQYELATFRAQQVLDGEVIKASRTRRVAAELELHRVKTLAAERLRHMREAEDRADAAEDRLATMKAREHQEFTKLLRQLGKLERAIKGGELPHLSRLLVSAECFIELEGYVRRNTDVYTLARHGGGLERLRGINVEVDDQRPGSITLSPKPEAGE